MIPFVDNIKPILKALNISSDLLLESFKGAIKAFFK